MLSKAARHRLVIALTSEKVGEEVADAIDTEDSGDGTILPNFTNNQLLRGNGTNIPITDGQLQFDPGSNRLYVGAYASSSNGIITVGGSGTGIGTIDGGGGALNVTGGPLTMTTHVSAQPIVFKPGTTESFRFLGTGQSVFNNAIRVKTRVVAGATVTIADTDYAVFCTAGGSVTANLPVGVDGMEIKVVSRNTSLVDITPNGSDTINGTGAPYQMSAAVTLIFAAGDWAVFN